MVIYKSEHLNNPNMYFPWQREVKKKKKKQEDLRSIIPTLKC